MKNRKGYFDLIGNESGVYMIFNEYLHKVYIGSSKNLKSRFREHLNSLKNNNHYNKSLQQDYNNNQISKHSFMVIKEISAPNLEELYKKLATKEEYCIKKFKSCNKLYGYNKLSKINPVIDRSNNPNIIQDYDVLKKSRSFYTYEYFDEILYKKELSIDDIDNIVFKISGGIYDKIENDIIENIDSELEQDYQ